MHPAPPPSALRAATSPDGGGFITLRVSARTHKQRCSWMLNQIQHDEEGDVAKPTTRAAPKRRENPLRLCANP